MCVHWSGVIGRENTFSGNSFIFILYNVYIVAVVVCVCFVFVTMSQLTKPSPPKATAAPPFNNHLCIHITTSWIHMYITICISIIKPSISMIPRAISIMYFMLTDIAYKYCLWFSWKIVLFFIWCLSTIGGKKNSQTLTHSGRATAGRQAENMFSYKCSHFILLYYLPRFCVY